MNKKKISYKEKHKQKREKYSNILPNDEYVNHVSNKFVLLLNSDKYFYNGFSTLSHQEQLTYIALLREYTKDRNNVRHSIAEKQLNVIHEKTGSSYEEGTCAPLFVDEKRLVRMDCYGSINRRREDQLSPLYKYFRERQGQKNYKLSLYDLDASPNWRVMTQFQSFRNIEDQIKLYMQKNKFHPDTLKVMTVSDFCDVIYNIFANKDAERAHFVEKEDCIRNRYVRSFMKNYGNNFRNLLLSKKIDERCVNSLCNQMKRFGACDLDGLVVTEIYHTPRTLKALKRNGYNVGKAKVGDKIPQKLVDELIDENKANLILARDRNGEPVDRYVLPRLEVHHGYAVKFTDSESLAASNYPNHLVLVESKMHQYYYHLFDTLVKHDNMQTFFSHLNITDKQMRTRIGFAENDAVFGDLENNQEFLERRQEDLLHKANYYECQAEYMNNVAIVIKKHNIKVNEYGYNTYNSMADELHSFIADKLELTEFKKTVSIAHNTKSR